MKRLIAVWMFFLSIAASAQAEAPLRFGVLALRPKAQVEAQWRPLAAYLETALGRRVELSAYDYPELNAAVAQNRVDAVMTNPGHLSLLRHHHGLSAPLVSRIIQEGEHELHVYGGVIFARADKEEIASLSSLAGKRIAVPTTESFSAYQMQVYEMRESGAPPPDAGRLLFAGANQEAVIEEVLSGRADAGFVRTGLIEAMARDGRLDLGRIKIVHRQSLPGFPYASSTRLYPEWPVAVMPQADEHATHRLTIALLSLPPGKIEGVHGFTVPANYDGVEDVLRRLRAPPYDAVPEFTLADLWKKYTGWIVATGLLTLLLAALSTGLLLASRARKRAMGRLAESERRLEDLVQSVEGIVWEADPRTFRFGFVSAQAVRLLGYDLKRWADEPEFWREHIHPDDREWAVEYCRQATLDKSDHSFEYRMLAADGRTVWLHDAVTVVVENGQPVKLRGLMVDITARKQLEESLRILTTAVEQSPASIVITDLEANIQYVNPGFVEKTGYTAEEAIGQNPRILQSGRTTKETYLEMWGRLASGKQWHGELLNKRKDGGFYWEDVRIAPVKDAAGAPIRYVAVKVDITAHKRAEEALHESEGRYRFLFDNNPMPMWIFEEGSLRFLEVNGRAVEHYGYTREEFARMTLHDIGPGGEAPASGRTITLYPNRTASGEWRHRKKNGALIDVVITTAPMQQGGTPARIALIQDITGRKEAEKELRDKTQLLDSIVENIPNMIFLKRASDLRFEMFNRAGEELLGYDRSELIGRNDYDFFPKEQADFFTAKDREVLQQEGVVDIPEEPINTPKGTRILHTRKITLRDEHGMPRYLLGISGDITERKEAEAKLRKSEAGLAEAQHLARIGSWEWIVPSNRATWSDETYHIFGVPHDTLEAHRQGFLDLVHPGDRDRVNRALNDALEGVREYDIEYRIILPDGTEKAIHALGEVTRNDKGEPVSMRGTVQDITERKAAEGSMRAQARLLDLLFKYSLDSIVLLDKDYNFIRVSETYAKSCQREQAEFPGHNHFEFYPSDLRDEFEGTVRNKITYMRSERPFVFPEHPEWGVTYWDLACVPVLDRQEEIEFFIFTLKDVTQRKLAEERLRASEARLRATLDNSPYLIWQKDVEGRYTAVNLPFLKTTGREKFEDVLGKTDLDLWPRDLAEKYRADDAEVLAACTRKVVDEQAITEDGRRSWVETYKTPILDSQGNLLGTAGFAQDITERKQYIEGLRKAQQLAEEIAAAKSSFLANMSHEIRTPMNAIVGLSQLALNRQSPPEVRAYLEKILGSSHTLLDILNDILDLSKIEAMGITIEHDYFDLGIVLENLDDLFAARAEDKFLDFGIEAAPDVPRNLVGDALRLQQVLSNLLGNAIKFTEHGKVALRVALKEIADGKATLRFSVEDTGIGIAREDIPKLFQPFSQVDGSITRRFGGTGLGLAISHELLKLMGGEFSVEGAPGKGATFSFDLALDVAGAPALPAASRRKEQGEAGALSSRLREHGHPLAGARILVAEDDAINQQVVREFLELSGVAVTLAGNGREALEALEKDIFDAVLMDVHMPVMDGVEATRQIRAQPRFAELPVIALTADVASEDRGHYLACGMNELLAKPVSPEEMISVLARWVKGEDAEEE